MKYFYLNNHLNISKKYIYEIKINNCKKYDLIIMWLKIKYIKNLKLYNL